MQLFTIYGRQGVGEVAWEEHRVILAALLAGDAHTAADAMRAHLTNGFERMPVLPD